MTSPNKQIPEVVSAPNAHVQITDSLNFIDAMLYATLHVDFSGGDVTLTDTEFNENGVLVLENAAASQTLNLPARGGFFLVANESGQSIDIQVTGGGGASVSLANGDNVIVASDGTDCRRFPA